MNLLKYSLLGIFISAYLFAFINKTGVFAPVQVEQKLVGTWQVDLRPTRESDPYYKNFIIEKVDGKKITGEFYDSKFNNGYINTSWDNIYIGFTTKDKKNNYFHTVTVTGNEIEGITYSPEREFTSRWTGKKL